MSNCIFCSELIQNSPIEHIVPESLGNIYYLLKANTLCRKCNNIFSKFEGKAIVNSHLGFIRIKNGIQTKKGKPSTFQIDRMKGLGSDTFVKNQIKLEGAKEKFIDVIDPKTGTMIMTVPDFYKSEAAAAKMLLKIGFESIYKSQPKLFQNYIFKDLKDYLLGNTNYDWPFVTVKIRPYPFKSIVSYNDKHQLNKIKCGLHFAEVNNRTLLFEFKYDYFIMVINLLNRDHLWTENYIEGSQYTALYPRYLPKSNVK